MNMSESTTMDAQQNEQTQETAVEAVTAPVEPKTQPDGFIDFDKWDTVTPDQVKERLGRETRIKREQERELQSAREAQKRLEKELLELRKPQEVAAPTEDMFISDPERAKAQLDQYTESIKQQQQYQLEQSKFQQREEQETLQRHQERVGRFAERAKTAGIDEYKLTMAVQEAVRVLPEDLQQHLSDHPMGPRIVALLHDNPTEMQELASLAANNRYEAGVKLNQLAAKFQPATTSNAPPPDEPVNGRGSPAEDENPWLKGVEYL